MHSFDELIGLFSTPRPSGSAAERATATAIASWLDARGIGYREHRFWLRPFFFEGIGAWLIASRSALALAVARRQGWRAALLAAAGLAGGTLDVMRGWPLVTWPGARMSRSFLVSFGPPNAERELMLCTHYDSKTELFNNQIRGLLTSRLRLGIALTVLLGLLGPLDAHLARRGSPAARLTRAVGLALALPLLALAWGLGLHLALGRLAPPSTGAVDNGAACAILLALAERMARGEGLPQRSRVTIVLFGGEEVNMQGSRAYVRDQAPDPARTSVVNLEMMGQDGAYLQWAADGDALRLWPTDLALRRLVDGAVRDRTGADALVADWINSDGGSFLMAGIPAAVLGTLDRRLGLAGMHGPDDRPERIGRARLAEDVALVAEIVRRFDAEG